MMNFSATTYLRTTLLVLLTALLAACSQELLDQAGGAVGGGSGDFAELYQTSTFQMCKDCHTPGAPGRTAGTEATQDWSSKESALRSLKGKASGLVGNFAGCNGVALVGATANTSLIVAVFDPSVRASFSVAGTPACNGSAIADESLRVGPIPPGTLSDLKSLIDSGAFR